MCDHAATSGREVAWARASWLGSHAPLREAVLEFYEALVVPLVGQRRGRMARRLPQWGLRWLNVQLLSS
jgi:hypothetical protein